eukprot:TRINITY_DN1438_c0_g1_i4.p1 TRINITY_DN1438_c0_g1~~TRINITY_DN1438_c0_g1_i4.p1  ORF type:complete len:133 (-),score=29.08 TRINITY_DN1438_c0_g1_i4:66-464(-)
MKEEIRKGHHTSQTIRHCSLCESHSCDHPYIIDPETNLHLSLRKKNRWKEIEEMEKEDKSSVFRTTNQRSHAKGEEIVVVYPRRDVSENVPNIHINTPAFLTNGNHRKEKNSDGKAKIKGKGKQSHKIDLEQ